MVRKSKDYDPVGVGIAVVFVLIFLIVAGWIFGDKKEKKRAQIYGPYKPKYTNRSAALSLPTADEAKTAATKTFGKTCKFLLTAKKHLARDYIILADRSGSMFGSNWQEAEEAVKILAPACCAADPDGITLIFFDDEVVKFDNIKSPDQVRELFSTHKPRGGTDLARGLDCAFQDHFDGTRGATSILVITDGCPNSRQAARDVIVQAAAALEVDAELSISFIQIGKDRSATKYLQELDDEISEAKFDIVDTLTTDEAKNMSFNELIARSIFD